MNGCCQKLVRHHNLVSSPAKLTNGTWSMHTSNPTLLVFRVDDKVHGECEIADIDIKRPHRSIADSKPAINNTQTQVYHQSETQQAIELAQRLLAHVDSLPPGVWARRENPSGQAAELASESKVKMLELCLDRTGIIGTSEPNSPLKTGMADRDVASPITTPLTATRV